MAQATNFTGTGVAIVTPFTIKGVVDFSALTKLVEHLIKGRVEYIVVLGTTGETATLSVEEKKQVIAHIIKTTKKRVPLVLGVGGNNTAELVEQLKKDDLSGFDAILSVSPYYNKPSQEGIYQHYKAIAKASPLPIILYNVPGRTASNMTAETTLRLANEFKNIIAIKEASGNIEQCMKIIKHRPDNFLIISGDDNLTLPLIASGAAGVISVVANAYPKDVSDMVRHAAVHDIKTAQKLHYKLIEITEQLFVDGNPGGVKVVLAQKKITQPTVRLPLVEPNDAVKAKLKKIAY